MLFECHQMNAVSIRALQVLLELVDIKVRKKPTKQSYTNRNYKSKIINND